MVIPAFSAQIPGQGAGTFDIIVLQTVVGHNTNFLITYCGNHIAITFHSNLRSIKYEWLAI